MIDVRFNFQADLNKGRSPENWLDADRHSKELQEAHRILWSKALPNGKPFTLEKFSRNRLRHNSELGEFILSSDRAVPTFFNKISWIKQYSYLDKIPKDETQSFWELSETIGGIIIWPAQRKDGNTINQNRCFGSNRILLADRLDLTLECIRRYYDKKDSPLFKTLKRYDDFFVLFENFKEYVDFFVFQDWVEKDYSVVRIATPFDDFRSPAVPETMEKYLAYRHQIMELVENRNRRIAAIYNTIV